MTRPARLLILATFLVCNVCFVTACGGSGPNPDDYAHTSPYPYYLYIPTTYNPDTRWPVFIGVHGAGRTGRDCWNDWQRYADEEGFILICPSLDDGSGGWYQEDGEEKLNAILRAVNEEYSIKNRYFLAGFSAGGSFVEGYGFRFPKWVAAVSMISAGSLTEATNAGKGVPYLVIVGGNETDRLEMTKAFADYLTQVGYSVSFQIIPDTGHTMTDEARNLTIDFYRQYTP